MEYDNGTNEEEDFKDLINNNSPRAMDYFSINNDGDLVIAVSEEVYEQTEEDGLNMPEHKVSCIITEQILDYTTLISPYSTPITFFITLGIFTRNPAFLEDVANLVGGEDKTIELTVIDTVNTKTEVNIKGYTEHNKIINNDTGESNEVTKQHEEKITTRTVSTTAELKLTYVSTWVCRQSVIYTKLNIPSEVGNVQTVSNPYPDKPKSEENATETNNEYYTIKNWITDAYETTQETTEYIIFDDGVVSSYSDKTDSFVELLKKEYEIPNSKEKRRAGDYLKSSKEMFFAMLRQNPETQGMESIMRLIMYKYTGENYGVTELDFSMFNTNDFSNVSTGSTASNFIKSWLNKELWEYESGKTSVRPTRFITTEDSIDYYIICNDGGNNYISYGIEYKNYKNEFSSYSVNNIRDLEVGDKIPKEAADAVFNDIISDVEVFINTYLSMNGITLGQTQKDALIAIKYKYGNIGNFVEAYNQYNNTSELRNAFVLEGGIKPFSNATDEYNANWQLFNANKYIGSNGEEIKSSILDIAASIHKYMEQNHYTYCVYYDPKNSQEECASPNECYLAKTFEKSKTSKKTCCATYVSWVLQEAGYLTESEHSNSAPGLRNYLLNTKKWNKITGISNLRPGDVICYSGHIEIYAGDSKVYSAGSGPHIRESSPYTKDSISNMMFALRTPY